MINFFSENPFAFILLMCLCNPPGLLAAAGLYYLARRYNIRSPFIDRGRDDSNI